MSAMTIISKTAILWDNVGLNDPESAMCVALQFYHFYVFAF
jgi:hypothetical protein